VTSRAVVIGIESYAQCKAGLTGNLLPGVTTDALHFYDWLIRDARLKPEGIFLHLQPASGTPAQAHPRAVDASYDAICDSLYTLRERYVSQTERLYVFFSGHGFQFGSDIACRPEDVLVGADFVDLRRSGNRTLRVGELLAVLAGLGPGEQYYFLDACRNLISPAALSVGNLGINLPPSPLGPPSQFVLFSTGQGMTAAAPTPFVATLVDGLRGAGQAKQWGFDDSDAGGGERLLVSFQSLFGHVSGVLGARSGQPPSRQIYGDAPGELVVLYPPGPEPITECVVHVSGIAPQDVVIATAQLGPMVAATVNLTGGSGVLPLRSALPYMVSINGGAKYTITPARRAAPLFQPLTLDFSAAPRAISFNEDPDAEPGAAAVAEWAAGAAREVPVRVRVPAVNALTAVELRGRVRDAAGRLRQIEHHLLPASQLAAEPGVWLVPLLPGAYEAVLYEAGKVIDTQPLVVEPESPGVPVAAVELAPPPIADPLQQALRVTILLHDSRLARWLRQSADNSLAVTLALVAADLAWPTDLVEKRAWIESALALPAAGQPGLLLLVAGPRGEAPTVSGLDAPPLREHPDLSGLYTGFAPLPPADYTGTLRIGGEAHLASWPVLPGRLTAVVVVARPELPPSYNLYLLPARHAESALSDADLRGLEPYATARLLESAASALGRRAPLPAGAAESADPLLALMQAYTLLRTGQNAAAQALLAELAVRCPGLPDVAMLQRLSQRQGAPDGAAAGAPTALPLFREGAAALSAAERAAWGDSAAVSYSGPFLRLRLPS
jgi:hypothetical protein